MKKILYIAGIALFLAGCALQKDEPEIQQQWKPLSVPRAAATFRSEVASAFPVSISVPASKLPEYATSPGDVVAQWKSMGIKEVFIQVDSPNFLGKWSEDGKTIRMLFTLLRANGMVGGLWIREIDWRCPKLGLVIHGKIPRRTGREARILEEWKSGIAKQQNRPEEAIKPEKIVVELGSRHYTTHSRQMPAENLYAWSDAGYGKNGENTRLFESSVRADKEFGLLFGVPVVLALDCEYLLEGQQGRLPGADVGTLLNSFDGLIVTSQAARPGSNAQGVLPFLTDERVYAGIHPAAHTSFSKDGLRRRSYEDFIASMTYLEKKWSNTSCRKVAILEFDRLEALMECAEIEGRK